MKQLYRASVAGTVVPLVNRLSSGTKMLFIMTVALMPLGLIALFASVQSARVKQAQHVAEARIVAAAEARQIDLTVLRAANILRLAAANANLQPSRCLAFLNGSRDAVGANFHAGLFDPAGHPLCSTDPAIAEVGSVPRGSIGANFDLRPSGLRFTVRASGGAIAVGDLPQALMAAAIGVDDRRQGVSLVRDHVRLPLVVPARSRAFDRRITVSVALGGNQVALLATSVASSISAVEVALVLLPLLMWAAAAIIGWIVVNELLLRPLAQLQRAVATFGAGPFILPRLSTPAREIRTLGEAFADATAEIEKREHALSEAFDHQVKLTREVHHRVKNNLQVVASLINLHARGSAGDVAAAYASIQRRVDALAIVHRNHFAELEVNRGLALRALVAELTGNLRATAPPAAGQLQITLDMAPAHVSQDVAVPVAFLITEIVELVMDCGPNAAIEISLLATQAEDRAILAIGAPVLREEACLSHPMRERFERIVAGLARQLRAPLAIDPVTGQYSISISVFPSSED